jgi:hypothetical protein
MEYFWIAFYVVIGYYAAGLALLATIFLIAFLFSLLLSKKPKR